MSNEAAGGARLTRETKVGLVVAGSFLVLVGVVIFCKFREGPAPDAGAQANVEDRPVPDEAPPAVEKAGSPPASTLPAAAITPPAAPVSPPPAGTGPGEPTPPPPPAATEARIEPDPNPNLRPAPAPLNETTSPIVQAGNEARPPPDLTPPVTPPPGSAAATPPPLDPPPPPTPPPVAPESTGPGPSVMPAPTPPTTTENRPPPTAPADNLASPPPPVTPPPAPPPAGTGTPAAGTGTSTPAAPPDLTPPAPPVTPPTGTNSPPPPPVDNRTPTPAPATPPGASLLQPVGIGTPPTPIPGTPVGTGTPARPPGGEASRSPIGAAPSFSATPTAVASNPRPLGVPIGASAPPITVPAAGGRPIPPVQVDSFDEEEYRLKAGETLATVSMQFYRTDKYAQALLLFNRNHPLASPGLRQDPPVLQPGQAVFIPPTRILEKRYGSTIPDLTPAAAPSGGERSSNASPPAAPAPQYAQYRVGGNGELLWTIAQRTLGSGDRWRDIHQLNPTLRPELPVPAGTTIYLPADARVDAAPRP